MSTSAIPASQQARATELSQLTTQQLIDHILALEAVAASNSALANTHNSITSSAAPSNNHEPSTVSASRKHKRPHSDHLTTPEFDSASDNTLPVHDITQPAVDALTSPDHSSSSTTPLPPPSSPVPPPTKQQRLDKQPHKHTTRSSTTTKPTAPSPPPPPPATFDYWSYPIRHIALRFLYLGTPFYGFSSQPSSTLPTVESHLFHALLSSRLIVSRASSHYQRCGRTDRGVHATGQVVSVWLRSRLKVRADGAVPVGWVGEGKKRREKEREVRRANGEIILVRHQEDALQTDSSSDDNNNNTHNTHNTHTTTQYSSDDEAEERVEEEKERKEGAIETKSIHMTAQSIEVECMEWEKTEFDYIAMLNRYLPPTIRILSYHPVPLTFSARFSCHRRTYHYLFYHDGLDIDRMRAAGSLLCGKHDWRNFCTYDVTAVTHFIRRIHRVHILPESQVSTAVGTAAGGSGSGELDEVVRRNAMWRVEVEGKGFLYHQVRCMVSVLFAIGRHEEPVELVTRLLDITQTPYKPAYRMASEKGLILQHSAYDEFADAAAWPTTAHSTTNLVRCYTALYQQQRQLAMEAAVVRHMAATIHTSLLRLAGQQQEGSAGESGLMSQIPFQLDDRVNKRWLCNGELLREANLQRSLAERVQSLTGKRRERRQKVERLREEWKRSGGSGQGEVSHESLVLLSNMDTNDKTVK